MKYSVIGSEGAWAKNIIKSLDSTGLEIHSLYDINKNNELSLEQILSSDVNVVIVATNPESHFEIAQKVIGSKKHLWLEKPATLSYKNAQTLVREAESFKVKFHVDLTWLYDSQLSFIRDLLRFKRFGKVKGASLVWKNYGKFQKCGVNWDLNPHTFSISTYLFGFPEGVAAFGNFVGDNFQKTFQTCKSTLFYRDFNVDIDVSWLSPTKTRLLQIITDKGIIETEFSGTVEFISFKGEHKIYRPPYIGSPLEVQLIHLDECLKQNIDTLTHGRFGMNITKLLELCEASLDSKAAKMNYV